MIKVMLVDDHQILRDGLRLLIDRQEDMCVAAEASSGEEALSLLGHTEVDLIVLDLGLPGLSGFDTLEQIKRMQLSSRVVILSMYADQEIVTQAIKLGADGIVPKSAAHTHLLEAVRKVAEGKEYLHPEAVKEVMAELGGRSQKIFLLNKLSGREYQVMELTARGYTSRAIGESLSLSPKTIETYRLRIMEKLSLKNRADLVQLALKQGMLRGHGQSLG